MASFAQSVAVKNCLPYVALCCLALGAGICSAAEPVVPKPELRTAREVDVKYHISLPKGWNAESTWPIMVTLTGSGRDFAQNFDQFTKARGKKLPFIVVTPCVNSLGKDPADLQAVLTIVKEVQKEFNGQPRFFVTGFSAGAHLIWQLIFLHPDFSGWKIRRVASNGAKGQIQYLTDHACVPRPRKLCQTSPLSPMAR